VALIDTVTVVLVKVYVSHVLCFCMWVFVVTVTENLLYVGPVLMT